MCPEYIFLSKFPTKSERKNCGTYVCLQFAKFNDFLEIYFGGIRHRDMTKYHWGSLNVTMHPKNNAKLSIVAYSVAMLADIILYYKLHLKM